MPMEFCRIGETDWCIKMLEETIAKSFPNLIKDIHLQIQEVLGTPNKIDSRKTI